MQKELIRDFAIVDGSTLSRAVADFMEISAEQCSRLCCYRDLLTSWNSRVNLVSSGDLRRFWSRHCYESAQLLRFLPESDYSDYSLTDLGSGAGFPGLVISILRPRLSVTLFESNQKKAAFLAHVSRETCSSARVIAERIESSAHETDIVVARALGSIDKTFELLSGWRIGERLRPNLAPNLASNLAPNLTPNLSHELPHELSPALPHELSPALPRALLLKGSRWQTELAEARKHWKISAYAEQLSERNTLARNTLASLPETSSDASFDNSLSNFSERTLNIVVKVWDWSAKRTKHTKHAKRTNLAKR